MIGFAALVVVLIASAGWVVYRWSQREAPPRYIEGKDVETHKHEQILSELQGIELGIGGREGRGVYVKVERLVRIFLSHEGIDNAIEMSAADLQRLLSDGAFTSDEILILSSLLEACEGARKSDSAKVEGDPARMVAEFRAIVQQREARKPS